MNELLWLGLGLLAAALLLIIIEVFIPSGGIISLVATAVAIAGVVTLFRVSVGWGVAGVAAMLVLAPLTFFFALQMLPSTPMGRKLMFGEGGKEQPVLPVGPSGFEALIGAEGVALTDLRPVGVVVIDAERIDAVSETSFVRAGTKVRVTGINVGQLRVRPISSPSETA